ncbi:MAG: alpha/beta hydrolase [Deltaproteobacteria bacterium]|nr:alpha/beta hydrolase [Deltaproteobacteria bacterium]
MQTVIHGKVRLALHELRGGLGRALLLLHGLGERSPSALPPETSAWPGPVLALDFTGHGQSTVPAGGGYTAEILMADADAALAQLGAATLMGRGIGAYVALLLAGARPLAVRGAILRDGAGLAGGGPRPGGSHIPAIEPDPVVPPDPFAVAELSRDIRPPDYASSFARQAAQLSGLDHPITVCAIGRPDWLRAVIEEPGVEISDPHSALRAYAKIEAA